jgi:polyhydroxyalkanoate synthesis regulator protein
MQGMIGNYLEQSAKVFLEMQEQMRKQARGMFGAFQFPGFPPGQAGNEDK